MQIIRQIMQLVVYLSVPGLEGGPRPRCPIEFWVKKKRKSSTEQVWNSPRRVKNVDTVNERRISKCWQKVCLLFLTFFKSLLQLLNLFKYTFWTRIWHWVDKCGSSVIKKNLTQYVFCYKTEMYVWLWVVRN